MKRVITYILALLGSTNSLIMAQQTLRFDSAEHDFGSIREDGGKVSHKFRFENTGEDSVKILDVITTCGCTVPTFPAYAIPPHGKGEIEATYDPMNRPGVFAKELYVYSTQRRRLATLTIKGDVQPRVRTTAERYPFKAGVLRLSADFHAFAYVRHGMPAQSAIGILNDSDKEVTLSLEARKSSGVLTLEYPRRLAPHEMAAINIMYDIPAGSGIYGTLDDLLDIKVNGRATGETIAVTGIAVDGLRDGTTSPRSDLRRNILKFGEVGHSTGRHTASLTLGNTGSAPLVIRRVEISSPAVKCSLAKGTSIAVGGSCDIKFTLDTADVDFGAFTARVIIITDDPQRPMRQIRITAAIIQQ